MKNIRTLNALVLAAVVSVAGVSHAAAAVKLKGVDPAFYMQKRNHKPDVSAELKALPVEVSLSVLRDPSAFVIDAHQKDSQRLVELRALKQGALTALAAAKDARAAAAIEAAVSDTDVEVAAVAAERLGEVEGDAVVVVLAAVVHDASRDVSVRAGAAAGLGRHRDEKALNALVAGLDKSHGAVVQAASMRALANLASRWAWQARGDVATGDRLRAAAFAAVNAVDGSDAEVVAARAEALALLR